MRRESREAFGMMSWTCTLVLMLALFSFRRSLRQIRTVRVGALALLIFVCSGCPRPGCPTMPISDANQALRMHRSLRRTIRTVRGVARVDQRGEQGRVRGTVLISLERPDRIRLEAMTQFGPVAVLTSDGEDFQLLDMRENRFLEGPASPENISRLLDVALSGEAVARFLLGDSPRLPEAEPVMACGDEGYRIEMLGEDGRRQEIILVARGADEAVAPEEQHLRLVRSELFDREGNTLWRASFEDYQVVRDPGDAEGRGVALPFVVRFEDPRNGGDTLIRMRELTIETEAPAAEVFHQEAPPGVTIERL
ncbi:MAG: hypothetical protein ACI9KE_000882 [Polyangiales bacterium]|jgi:hypothetical protein